MDFADVQIPAGISAIIGLVLPYVIYHVNNMVESSKWRYVIALGTSLVTGVVVALVTNQFSFANAEDFFVSMSIVFGVSQSVYALYWKDKIKVWLEKKNGSGEQPVDTGN